MPWTPIFSFSYKPLKMMTLCGTLISGAGFILACLFVIKRLAGIETAQTGFTTLVTLILFLGGVQLIAVGILGEYLARIYDEVKQRPLYIVKKGYGVSKKLEEPCESAESSNEQSSESKSQKPKATLAKD